jgi:hypothetical protein
MSSSEHAELPEDDDMADAPPGEFNFDRARPNRFACQEGVRVTLAPDIAQVFHTSDEVNHALRALLAAVPANR